MAVQVILRMAAALCAIGLAVMVMTPVMYRIKGDTNLWADIPEEGIAIRDNVYQVYALIAVPMVGVVILWGFMHVTRKGGGGGDDFGYGDG